MRWTSSQKYNLVPSHGSGSTRDPINSEVLGMNNWWKRMLYHNISPLWNPSKSLNNTLFTCSWTLSSNYFNSLYWRGIFCGTPYNKILFSLLLNGEFRWVVKNEEIKYERIVKTKKSNGEGIVTSSLLIFIYFIKEIKGFH